MNGRINNKVKNSTHKAIVKPSPVFIIFLIGKPARTESTLPINGNKKFNLTYLSESLVKKSSLALVQE